jgi:hypothetical protein
MSSRRIGWLGADIDEWLASRPRLSYGAASAQVRQGWNRKARESEGAKE